MSTKKRIETLIIEVVEEDGLSELMKKHCAGELVSGCRILGWAAGDKMNECEKLEDKLYKMKEKIEKALK